MEESKFDKSLVNRLPSRRALKAEENELQTFRLQSAKTAQKFAMGRGGSPLNVLNRLLGVLTENITTDPEFQALVAKETVQGTPAVSPKVFKPPVTCNMIDPRGRWYYKLITEPLCLLDLHHKCKVNQYISKEDYLHDIKQLVINCVTYNGPKEHSIFSATAELIQTYVTNIFTVEQSQWAQSLTLADLNVAQQQIPKPQINLDTLPSMKEKRKFLNICKQREQKELATSPVKKERRKHKKRKTEGMPAEGITTFPLGPPVPSKPPSNSSSGSSVTDRPLDRPSPLNIGTIERLERKRSMPTMSDSDSLL
eukprot:Platyproteum_vivax@DN16333_c0_g1_i1.p1